MTESVLVIGGRGFIGRQVVALLGQDDRFEPWIGSRQGGEGQALTIDLTAPEPGLLSPFRYLVNCTSAYSAPPDALLDICLKRGKVLLDANVSPDAIERLYRSHREETGSGARDGTAVLGAGLFPGVSNLLARHAHDRHHAPIELGIRLNPLSGAGRGMCELMARLLGRPCWLVRESQLQLCDPLAKGPTLPFPGGAQPTLRLGLPEPWMLMKSAGLPDVGLGLAIWPGFVNRLVRWLSPLIPGFLLQSRAFQWLAKWQLMLSRGLLLRWRASAIEMVAASEGASLASLRVEDGRRGTAAALVAMLGALTETEPDGGVHLPDECFELEPTVAEMERLGCEVALQA